MKMIEALLALVMAVCFVSMPVMCEEYHVWIPAMKTTGNINVSVHIQGEAVNFANSSYRSVIVYNRFTDKATNFDKVPIGYRIPTVQGDTVYEGWAEEITFNDSTSTIGGALTLTYYPGGAPAKEIYIKAVEAALKVFPGGYEKLTPVKFAGYDSYPYMITNPVTGKLGKTSFFQYNKKDYVALTGDFTSYSLMNASMNITVGL